jgi:hypothetical protein
VRRSDHRENSAVPRRTAEYWDNEAIQSANSGNPVERDFAIGVLSDIGTRGAENYLRMLTKDKNRGVALDAKMEFAYRHFGQQPPEAEFLDSAGSTKSKPVSQRHGR